VKAGGQQLSIPALNIPSTGDDSEEKPKPRRRAPTIVLEKIDAPPSYGENPGPDGSLQRKEAYELRKMDAEPDEIRIVREC
jgi:pyruvate/2-oxoacid:ferredoxin oxidoreductase alpha subunit